MILIPNGNGGFIYIPTNNHYQTTESEDSRPRIIEKYTEGEIFGIASCALLIVILGALLIWVIMDEAEKG